LANQIQYMFILSDKKLGFHIYLIKLVVMPYCSGRIGVTMHLLYI